MSADWLGGRTTCERLLHHHFRHRDAWASEFPGAWFAFAENRNYTLQQGTAGIAAGELTDGDHRLFWQFQVLSGPAFDCNRVLRVCSYADLLAGKGEGDEVVHGLSEGAGSLEASVIRRACGEKRAGLRWFGLAKLTLSYACNVAPHCPFY